MKNPFECDGAVPVRQRSVPAATASLIPQSPIYFDNIIIK